MNNRGTISSLRPPPQRPLDIFQGFLFSQANVVQYKTIDKYTLVGYAIDMKNREFLVTLESNTHHMLDQGDVIEMLGYHIGQDAAIIHFGRNRGKRIGVLGSERDFAYIPDPKLDLPLSSTFTPLNSIDYWLKKSKNYYRLGHWLYWKVVNKFDPKKAWRKLEALWNYYQDDTLTYKFTPRMGQISGFGGSYEMTCRRMLNAGLVWLDDNPNANLVFKSNANVIGVVIDETEDDKELSDIIIKASGDDCTGAMHQAVISRIMWIRNYSWKNYVEKMKE